MIITAPIRYVHPVRELTIQKVRQTKKKVSPNKGRYGFTIIGYDPNVMDIDQFYLTFWLGSFQDFIDPDPTRHFYLWTQFNDFLTHLGYDITQDINTTSMPGKKFKCRTDKHRIDINSLQEFYS